MTGFTPQEDKNPPVNKRILISAVFVVIIIFGSFGLRELFPDKPIIKRLFGGLNIFLFWAVSFYIFHRVDNRIFTKGHESLKSKPPGRGELFVTKRVLIVAILIVLLFVYSLQFFHGINLILFWLVFLIAVFLIGLGVDYMRKKNKHK